MIKNALMTTAVIALFAAAPSITFAKSGVQLTTDELASFCDQSGAAGDTDAMLDVGSGSPVAITVHCDTAGMSVSSNDDSESESGPSEAAENGVED